ncbi:Coumarine and phenylpropanoid biosynthesis [Scheffersomyces coipomensis]|uniref:Coumarine and phenylpropanoid biosynthesis n=1 Tax=Scheffersomyces coipomensis TaxID=1788519 RepID=UPI00315CD954
MTKDIYLVTGGTGHIASFVILQLLEQGHIVKTSIRTISKADQLKQSFLLSSSKLTQSIIDSNLIIFKGDLANDEDWHQSQFDDVKYILHLASPLTTEGSTLDEFVIPATKGTLRVLQFANKAPSVKHVVITSSFAAIGYGLSEVKSEPFTEEDWTIVNEQTEKTLRPYQVSKTLAEKSAWEFIKDPKNNVKFGLTTINPNLIYGPTLTSSTSFSASLSVFKSLIDGTYATTGVPSRYVSVIDVRDVAKIHIEALTNPKANNQRFILNTGISYSLFEISEIIRKIYPHDKELLEKLPSKEDESKPKDFPKVASNEKAKSVFNWTPIPVEESLKVTIDNIRSLN